MENNRIRRFIRSGGNTNAGTAQREMFILRQDGSIEGAIEWDYDTVTRVAARPLDATPLVIRGGRFTNIANQMRQETGSNYWNRGINITRTNTEVDGLSLDVTGEGEFGHPYRGFLQAEETAGITFRNCRIAGRKAYSTIGSAGRPVQMGTYGYGASLVVDFRMLHCQMDEAAIHDTTRWGVVATNFMKNMLVEDCVLSRIDVHQGVSGGFVIRRSTLGHQGIKAVGRGLLLVEDSTVHSDYFIDFLPDYGSTWTGDVVIRNCRWLPPGKSHRQLSLFKLQNNGTHDFGYPCSMPRTVRIDGLHVDDTVALQDGTPVVSLFGNPLGGDPGRRPFPYRFTESIEVRNLTTTSGHVPAVSTNPELEKAIRFIRNAQTKGTHYGRLVA